MDVQLTRHPTRIPPSSLSRRTALLGASVGVLASALAGRGVTMGQDATPATELVVEALGAGLPTGTPGRQLILARATFPAGFTLPAHSHPGPLVAFVESGTFGYTPVSGEARSITRATAPDTPETPTLGDEVVLAAGDALFHDEDVVGIDRAIGDEPAILLLAVLFDPTRPLYHLVHPEEGTPTP